MFVYMYVTLLLELPGAHEKTRHFFHGLLELLMTIMCTLPLIVIDYPSQQGEDIGDYLFINYYFM